MPKLKCLSEAHKILLAEVCDQFKACLVSTKTDPIVAEEAVREIIAPVMTPGYEVRWVQNPQVAIDVIRQVEGTFREKVQASLYQGLTREFQSSLDGLFEMFSPFAERLTAFIRTVELDAAVLVAPHTTQKFRDEVHKYVWHTLQDYAWDFGSDLSCTFRGSYHLAKLVFYQRSGITPFPQSLTSRLAQQLKFLEAAFAVWIYPGVVIICQKPIRTRRVRGILITRVFSKDLVISIPNAQRNLTWWQRLT